MPEDGSPRRHRVRRWIIGAVALAVVLAVAIPFIYIHFIEGSAPAKLTLPGTTKSTVAGECTISASAASVSGGADVDSSGTRARSASRTSALTSVTSSTTTPSGSTGLSVLIGGGV